MPLYDRANVLMVDDQPAKLLSYRAILDGLDANFVTANSAREALDHLLKTEFAVVIVDVCMPELDGFELAQMIRDHPRFRRTAIIFVSGVHLTDLDRLKGYEVGAVDYLQVPIVPQILRAKVNAFIELHVKTHELERLNRDLEQRVADRTAELEDANRRKDEFLAVLAHELRNPLAAIQSAAHMIRFADPSGTHLATSAGVIQRQIAQLVRLIDDLVDVSRITHGIIELQREPIEASMVVAQAIEATSPLIDAKKHTLTVDMPDSSMKVYGDAARLCQVIANVLNNSAKYTEPGGQIALQLERDHREIIIRVTDSGAGITHEMLPKVFDLFTRGDRALDRSSAGLGIGLALVHRLVAMHGGSVTATSQGPGTGTTITVRLPLCDDAVSAKPAAYAQAPPAPRVVESPCRVLVVDDNADAALTMALMLRMSGHEVETAEDGLQALEIASVFGPQVVLLDLGMPKLNGYETAKRIREAPWGHNVSLVALTGWGQPKDRQRTLEAGFNAHLVKPVGSSELMDVISRVAAAKTRVAAAN